MLLLRGSGPDPGPGLAPPGPPATGMPWPLAATPRATPGPQQVGIAPSQRRSSPRARAPRHRRPRGHFGPGRAPKTRTEPRGRGASATGAGRGGGARAAREGGVGEARRPRRGREARAAGPRRIKAVAGPYLRPCTCWRPCPGRRRGRGARGAGAGGGPGAGRGGGGRGGAGGRFKGTALLRRRRRRRLRGRRGRAGTGGPRRGRERKRRSGRGRRGGASGAAAHRAGRYPTPRRAGPRAPGRVALLRPSLVWSSASPDRPPTTPPAYLSASRGGHRLALASRVALLYPLQSGPQHPRVALPLGPQHPATHPGRFFEASAGVALGIPRWSSGGPHPVSLGSTPATCPEWP